MGVIGAAGVWIVPVDPLPLVYVIVLPLADSSLMYVVLMFCPAESPVALVAVAALPEQAADVPPLAAAVIVMLAVPSKSTLLILRFVCNFVALAALPVMLSPSMTNLVSGPHVPSLYA